MAEASLKLDLVELRAPAVLDASQVVIGNDQVKGLCRRLRHDGKGNIPRGSLQAAHD